MSSVNPQMHDSQGRYIGKTAALADTLVAALTAQRDLYIQLATLARQQSQCVATGETEQLMTVLAARARLIDEITPLDRQLQPYKDKWQQVLDTLPAQQRQDVSMLLTQVQQLLADLLEQDEADRQALLRQKTEVGEQIGKTVTGTQLNKAYGVRPKGPGMGMGMG